MADTESTATPALRAALPVVGLTLIGYGLSQFLHRASLGTNILTGGLALLAIVIAFSAWRRRRWLVVRRIREAVASVMNLDDLPGLRPIRVRRWRGGRSNPRPSRLTLRYSPAFHDGDPANRKKVEEVLRIRLGAPVTVVWHPTLTRIDVTAEVTRQPLSYPDLDATPEPEPLDDKGQTRQRAQDVVQSVFGATARVVDDNWEGDTLTRLEVSYATTSRDMSGAFRDKVLASVNTKLPGEWRDKWDLETDTVIFEPRPPFPVDPRFPLDRYPAGSKPRSLELAYAVTEDRQIESWKLGSANPHCLVIGPTGTGKTVFIRNLVIAAVLLGIPVVLCDPKRTEFLDFVDWPGVVVLTDEKDIARAVAGAFHEMMARYDLIAERAVKKGGFGKVLFVLDEFYIFKELIADVWKAMKAADKDLRAREHPCMGQWARLTVLARTAEIHLVAGIQRPDAEFLTGLVRDSFRKRVSLGPLTHESARMMWGHSRIGTDLAPVQGRATATTDRGPAEVQVLRLLTPSDDDAFGADDARQWEAIVRRVQATTVSKATTDTLDRIRRGKEVGHLVRRAMVEATDTPAVGADLPDFSDAEPEMQVTHTLVPVKVRDLEAMDQVFIDDDHGVPELVLIEDVQEDQDDPDVLTLGYFSLESNRAGTITLPVDQILQRREPDTSESAEDVDLLLHAVEQVVSAQYASTAMLQRKLRVGHQKTQELMTRLQELGVVGEHDGRGQWPVQVPAVELAGLLQHLRRQLSAGAGPTDAAPPRALHSGTSAPVFEDQVDDPEPEDDQDGEGELVPLSEIEINDLVGLDIDGTRVLVIVEDIEDNGDVVELSYRTAYGDEFGTVELDPDGRLPRH